MPDQQVAGAYRQFYAGRAQAARDSLQALLRSPAAAAPADRLFVAGALLEICLHNRDGACVARNAADFVAAAGQRAASASAVQRRRLALEAAYYVAAARSFAGQAPDAILADAGWSHEIAYDGDLYLRRQVLASNLFLQAGRRADLDRSVDKILSLGASLKNPQSARFTVAASLADVMATLLATGETDRAWGLYRASGADIAKALPPATLDYATYAITQGQLRQAVGDVAGARSALQEAAAALLRIELDPAVRDALLAQALTLRVALDAAAGDLPSAHAALATHPFAPLYARPGRAPANSDEVAYLAARAFVAMIDQTADPVVTRALQAPAAFKDDPVTASYRAAGLALALPPGPERSARLIQLGRKVQAAARQADKEGALDRLSIIDQILVALALSQADAARTPADADVAFSLFQLAGRTGASFDADALTALGQAKDELQRRTIHQALRLKARRDRLERQGVQRTTAAMLGPAETGTLAHDIPARGVLRDYDERLAQAEARLARDGLSLRGPRLVPLARLQAALGANEAALAVAPTFGGMAYMCVRRDSASQVVAPVDFARMKVDAKIVQAALTSTEAPSEALDIQFPAEAAVRLYDALLKPFATCLRPGDRIQWLGGVASAVVPLAALLPTPPPKLDHGYDLAQADWIVRRHAIGYAGSAGALVATRSRTAPPKTDFDFLGVGDPRLDGRLDDGQARNKAVLKGVRGGSRFEGLAPLPETADELHASARGFAASRLLLGEEATESGVRGQVLGDYRYLSFATHGLLRDDLQGLSDPALVLTPRSEADDRDDGLLTASEIADMNLGASFVALSACNTANFDFDQAAQDLPALASAFAVSGVPATLGTLWPVNSRTGEAVVSGLFERLRGPGGAPADALAEAQRAFLAAPPERAYLHPRFWAPFVILGDGAMADRNGGTAGPTLTAAEMLTRPGGEVLALASTPDGLAARFIAEADAAGAPGEGLRLAVGTNESWRKVSHQARASRVLGQLDEALIAGGYEIGAGGRLQPRLDAYDRQGRPVGSWRGENLSKVDAGILAAINPDASTMLIVVGERTRPGEAGGGTLRVLRVGPDLAPKTVFATQAPDAARISSAAIVALGDRLLLAYTADNHRSDQPAAGFEDYDDQVCALRRETMVELHDAHSGALLQSTTISGFAAVAGAVARGGTAMFGGSQGEGCRAERKAAVLAIAAGLKPKTLYLDDTLGASEVRALAPLPRGGLFVAAYKESLFDVAAHAGTPPRDAGSLAVGRSYSTLVLTLDGKGRPSTPKPLDAGADVLPTAALALEDGQALLGGSLAGQAAIFHFTFAR
ncbi:MAG TPA: CHAT domain-containing protein [Phenylobacterium sp.]|uniref:CHAT domain-containing protein n=1 Tax=Phenylobacterium sp. TaxID=1871053 RepID=UPI002B484046|nr:CHAT domain-containing protein [Phenylobacterium sp.]HKR89309.1 CHAT domain-containing protein [Phenylobacterium sp.]